MTMRTASKFRSPCEILRKINDISQGDNIRDLEIRELCAEGERKTKRLARELNKHDKKVWENWWEDNETFNADIDRRLKDDYLQEGSRGEIGKPKRKKDLKGTLVRWLNHYRYGREITGLLQSLMIGVIFLEQFNINRQLYFIIIPVTGLGFIFTGYLLKRMKIFQKDLEYRSRINPAITEILNNLKKIEDKL